MEILLKPIGFVRASRAEPLDDHWDQVESAIELDSGTFTEESLQGLDSFSHVEVLFYFDRVQEGKIVTDARRPRGKTEWPKVGIFAQRGKARPNRIGATICQVERVSGLVLHVTGLDAIDGTPVLDLKPVMTGFLPRNPVTEPDWAQEIMAHYW